MAFMAHGHVPGSSRYSPQLKKATDYLISCQKPNGLITLLGPDGPQINRAIAREIGGCGAYNHAISSLALSEIYGMSPREDQARLKSAIQKALYATLQMQRWPKRRPEDSGGWRYIDKFEDIDSDLSVTGWELMFLRSAKNAGFAVPKESIDDAIAFVKRSFDPRNGMFIYSAQRPSRTRSMAGAGIVALAHAGLHHSVEAQRLRRLAPRSRLRTIQRNDPWPELRPLPLRTFYLLPGHVPTGRQVLGTVLPARRPIRSRQPAARWFLAGRFAVSRRSVRQRVHNRACGDYAWSAESTDSDFSTMSHV